MGWGLPGILKYLPSPTLVTCDRIEETLSQLPAGSRICDVGAGGRRLHPQVVTVDAFPGENVDIVGDIHELPIPNADYDCVFCTGTLEHVADPWQAVREIKRIVRPGGIVHIDVPFIQGYHADPTDYWRFTIDGLRLLCKDFEELDSGVQIGPTCGLIWIMREWANGLTNNRILSNLLLIPVAVITAPFKYIDYLAVRSSRGHRVASALFFRGRKPAESAEAISSNCN